MLVHERLEYCQISPFILDEVNQISQQAERWVSLAKITYDRANLFRNLSNKLPLVNEMYFELIIIEECYSQFTTHEIRRAFLGEVKNDGILVGNQWLKRAPQEASDGNVLRRKDEKWYVLNAEKRNSNLGIDL